MDSRGGMSEQIDVIIFDRHFTPFLFNHQGVYFVPAESVYAVIEIRPMLSKNNIVYAGGKAASVRCLHRTSVPIPHAGGTYPAKPLFPILGGIVTRSTEWTNGLGAVLEKAVLLADPSASLDFGCALDTVAFEVNRLGKIPLASTTEENILLSFFMNLLDKLQALASVPALDFKAYGKHGAKNV